MFCYFCQGDDQDDDDDLLESAGEDEMDDQVHFKLLPLMPVGYSIVQSFGYIFSF